MRKKINALIVLVILTSLGIIIILNNKNKSYEITDDNNGQFAFYYEDDNGKYEKSTDTKWDSGNYILNISESTCDGEKNPEFLSWNKDNNSVILTRNKATKCSLYFSKIIKINYIEDLVDLSVKVNNGESYAGKTIVLTRDLDFQNSHEDDYQNKDSKDYNDFNKDNITGKTIYEELTDTSGFGFLPIGDPEHNFEGTFDGNNHTISNLYVNNVNNQNQLRLGLFGVINNSEISNLIVTGTIKNGTVSVDAGLIGTACGKSKLSAIVNKINITNEDYTWSTGGIVGASGNTAELTIEDCINYGTVIGGGSTGGIIGQSVNNSKVGIINSINYGEIKNSGGNNIGGLLGLGNTNTEIILENCKNYGRIVVLKNVNTNTSVGGLIGRADGSSSINNSSNEISRSIDRTTGIIVDNKGTGDVFFGGILGTNNGQITITKSHNSSYINVTSSETGTANVGGILGINNGKNINKIENCYNTGEIKGGTRVGGIAADSINPETILIINKCYNTGNLTGFSETKYTHGIEVGGIFCQAWDGSKVYILNSYNTGSLNANVKSETGGIAAGIAEQSGNVDYPSLVSVLNSYNSGDITAKTSAIGISRMIRQSNLTINNVYNIGSIDSTGSKNSIVFNETSELPTINNSYYLKQDNISPSNDSNLGGMYEITDEIKNNLVNILNENKNKINLSEYGEEIKDYELVNWIQGIDGYPTLEGVGDYYYQSNDIKYVRDLSGNENNGILYNIPKIDNEGITTSDDNTTGYVDCGLIGHDFKDRVTLIVRVRINKFIDNNLHQRMFGDWHSSGTVLAVVNTNVPYMASWTNEYGNRHNSSNFNLQLGQWYTIVGTFDKNGEKIYIDGNLLSTLNFSNETIKISDKHFLLGKGTLGTEDGSDSTYATYSDALIYDRALSEEEIKENFSKEISNINKDKLLLWYKFA